MPSSIRQIYRQHVPNRVRYPLGRWRRGLLDRWLRWRTPGRLPPRDLLHTVQMTPWIGEYLAVGRKSAETITAALDQPPRPLQDGARILDFGCGLSRTLRFVSANGWRLAGCDIDSRTVAWSRQALPDVEFKVNETRPPLPWPADYFDAVYAVSVFTHFDASEQSAWANELARVIRPAGRAVITSMGPHAFGAFPAVATAERRQQLADEGFVFNPGGEAFNARGAFHTEAGLTRFFAPWFELRSWRSGGLDGFQDLSILIRSDAPANQDIDSAPASA